MKPAAKPKMTAEEFRAVRQAAGLTQAEFGHELGAGLRQVQKWEGGESPIRPIVARCVQLWQEVRRSKGSRKPSAKPSAKA